MCSRDGISYRMLEQIVLADLNKIISAVGDLKKLAEEAQPEAKTYDRKGERDRLRGSLERVRRLKQSAYEDYKDGLIPKEDFLRYQADYKRQERLLSGQLEQMNKPRDKVDSPWIAELLKQGKLTALDRATVAEAIRQILVFEDSRVEITYTFSDDLGVLGR